MHLDKNDSLDEQQAIRLRSILRSLSDQFEIDAKFSSSPIRPLLTQIADQLLLASQLIEEGANFLGKKNPTIEFRTSQKSRTINTHEGMQNPSFGETFGVSDELGVNPKQIIYTDPDFFIWSPQIAELLKDMSEVLFRVLDGFSEGKSFMDFLSRKPPKKRKKHDSKVDRAQVARAAYAFHRRNP